MRANCFLCEGVGRKSNIRFIFEAMTLFEFQYSKIFIMSASVPENRVPVDGSCHRHANEPCRFSIASSLEGVCFIFRLLVSYIHNTSPTTPPFRRFCPLCTDIRQATLPRPLFTAKSFELRFFPLVKTLLKQILQSSIFPFTTIRVDLTLAKFSNIFATVLRTVLLFLRKRDEFGCADISTCPLPFFYEALLGNLATRVSNHFLVGRRKDFVGGFVLVKY